MLIARAIIAVVNVWRALLNLWRRLWRRRVDYVQVALSGPVAEFADQPLRWQRMLLGARAPLSVAELHRIFRRVALDPGARGVLLRVDGLSAGWATLQSIRAEVAELRASGRRVVAYLVTPDVAGAYVAAAADEVLMPPTVFWGVVGLRAEVRFLRDALARWGVAVEATAVSPYKSAPDQFTRTDFSEESRAQYERLVDLRFAELVRALAEARGKGEAELRALIDRAPLAPADALAAGLVDALCYEDELPARLKFGDDEPVVLDWPDAGRALRLPPLRAREGAVALVRVEGTIARGRSRTSPVPLPLIGGSMAGAETLAQSLRHVERSRRIKAAVLYVNSPGGEVFASDIAWREVQRVALKKPIVVAMGDSAASGGYYLATHASAIVARPATLTGSIGVFTMRPVAAGLLERAEVHTTVISRGANSGLLGGTEPPTESEREATRALVFGLYEDFKARVREGRRLSEGQLDPIAGGRVWLGAEAAEIGLVDELGGVREAMLRAQSLAGMPADPHAPLVAVRPRGETPPEPFPTQPAALAAALADALRMRAWALLPFDMP